MSRFYVPLPAPEIRNAMVDTSTLNQAADQWNRTRQHNAMAAYQRERDQVADQRYASETAYRHGRDAIGDARYADETAYNRGRQGTMDQRATEQHGWSREEQQNKKRQLALDAMAGLAQTIMESPEELRAARYQQFRQAIPDFDADMTAAGFDPNNWEASLPAIVARARGQMAGKGPAAVQEWQHFSRLPPDQQQQYLTMKRAEKYLDTGTEFVRPNPVAPGENVSTVPKNVAETEAQKAVGKASGERQAGRVEARSHLGNALSNLDRLATEVTEIMQNPKLPSVTGAWGYVPNRPGGAARDLATRIGPDGSLRSQIGFGVLQAMRDASKTGGALGQVSNIENVLLQNNLATLDTSQSPEEFRSNLQKVLDYVEAAKIRLSNAYQETYGETFQPDMQGPAANDPLGIR